jgi:hypothetical protein
MARIFNTNMRHQDVIVAAGHVCMFIMLMTSSVDAQQFLRKPVSGDSCRTYRLEINFFNQKKTICCWDVLCRHQKYLLNLSLKKHCTGIKCSVKCDLALWSERCLGVQEVADEPTVQWQWIDFFFCSNSLLTKFTTARVINAWAPIVADCLALCFPGNTLFSWCLEPPGPRRQTNP